MGFLDPMVYSFQHRHHVKPIAFIQDGPSLHMPLGNTSIVQFLVLPYILVYKSLEKTELFGWFLRNESVDLFFLTVLIFGMTAQVSALSIE